MESKSTTQAFLTIFFSAILHTALLLIIIGIPVRQFFSSRDPEAIEYQKEKRTIVDQPIRPAVSHDLVDIPAPVRMRQKHAKAKPAVEQTVKTEEKQPKIVDVNFDKEEKTAVSKVEDKKSEPPATVTEPKAQDPKAETESSEAVIEEDPTPANEQPKTESLPKQAIEKSEKPKPVVDKFAGVQAAEDDAATEATSTDANPPSPDAEAPKAIDSEAP